MASEMREQRKRKREPEELTHAEASLQLLDAAQSENLEEVVRLLAVKASVWTSQGEKVSHLVESYFSKATPKEEYIGIDRLENDVNPVINKVFVTRILIVNILKQAEPLELSRAFLSGLHTRVGKASSMQKFPPHPRFSSLADKHVMRLMLKLGGLKSRPPFEDDESDGEEDATSLRRPILERVVGSEYGTLDQVRALLRLKADVNATWKKIPILHTAVRRAAADRNDMELIYQCRQERISEDDEPNSDALFAMKLPHHCSVVERDPKVVQELLDAKADPNSKNELGETVLIRAIKENRAHIAELAGGENSLKIIKVLLLGKALPNERRSTNVTPLMIAASRGDEGAVKLLLEFGADAAFTRHSVSRACPLTAVDYVREPKSLKGSRMVELLTEAIKEQERAKKERTETPMSESDAQRSSEYSDAALLSRYSAIAASPAQAVQQLRPVGGCLETELPRSNGM